MSSALESPVRSEFADDPDMMELVEEFIQEMPGRIEKIQSCLAEQSMDELKVLAHQLKGAGGGYGFPDVTDKARQLEQSIVQGEAESAVSGACDALTSLLNRVQL